MLTPLPAAPPLPPPSPTLCAARIAEVDVDANGVVDFSEFVRVLQAQKERAAALGSESDMGAWRGPHPARACAAAHCCPLPFLNSPPPRHAPTARLSSAVDAFIACGGQPDKSGFVERDRLVRIVKEDFGLMCVARLGCPSIAP